MHGNTPGRLCIVGIGPGNPDYLAPRAKDVIAESRYVIGNAGYLDSISHLLEGKVVIRSSMGEEVERARRAVELASDYVVTIVSGGDPGIYGMAGIVLEVAAHAGTPVPIEVVPGITAATAAASLLGSPLSGDFAVISLSDLLTPREVIENRLRAVFATGIPVVLYNPRSRGRPDALAVALAIAGEYLPGSTPVGIVTNAYRPGTTRVVTTLAECKAEIELVSMHSTVVIGGAETWIWKEGKDEPIIITPRGYHRKYLY